MTPNNAQIVSTNEMGAERRGIKALQLSRVGIKNGPQAQRVGAGGCTHRCLEQYNS